MNSVWRFLQTDRANEAAGAIVPDDSGDDFQRNQKH